MRECRKVIPNQFQIKNEKTSNHEKISYIYLKGTLQPVTYDLACSFYNLRVLSPHCCHQAYFSSRSHIIWLSR